MSAQLPPLEKPLSERAEVSFTLPASWYLDPAVYEREKERIFYRTWQYVAHVSMLSEPGDYITLRICDENMFVIRDGAGELRAFYNICRHRAHELLEGEGNVRDRIVCPYHAWSYGLDGSLAGARMSQGRPGFDGAGFGLRPVRLDTLCGCIFVNLDDDAAPLAEVAPGLEADIREKAPYVDDLILAGTDVLGETRMDAGWKVVVDNYVECYHCIPAHPAFASIISMRDYQVDLFPGWSRQLGPVIRPENRAYAVDTGEGQQKSAFWYLWPNTTFNIMPGSDEMSVFAIRPRGVEQSWFGGHSLSVDGKVNPERAQYVADVLAPEDIGLCESVQRGLHSRSYTQGPIIVDAERSGTAEHGLHHFHRMVQAALQD